MANSTKTDPPPASAPSPHSSPLHLFEADEEDENVKQLNECSNLYVALQECLNRTNRNWKSCQPEVLALKSCYSRKNED